MRTKVLMIVMLMGLSAILVAQPAEKGTKKFRVMDENEMGMKDQKGAAKGLNLTDAQKEAFKQSTIAIQKQLQPLRNELREAEAHQKTLVTAEKPDLGAVNKNIEKIGGLRIEMAKIQTKHRLEMRAQLTDEQRLKFDLLKEKRKQSKGPGGMRHRMI